MQRLQSLFLALALLSNFSLQGATELSLDQSYDELFKSLMDDPSRVNAWSWDLIKKSTETIGELQWARAMALYTSSCLEIGCSSMTSETADRLPEAVALAKKHTDNSLYIRLLLTIEILRKAEIGENPESRAALDRIKAEAEARGGGRLTADVYREYAAAAETDSNLQEALLFAKQALELAQKDSYPGDILPILIKNDNAILFGHLGDEAQSVALYQEVVDFCIKEGIRNMGAVALINLGRIHSKTGDPIKVKKGLQFLDQADVIIKALKQDRLQAMSRLTRGMALIILKEYAESHQYLDQALVIIQSVVDPIWAADTYHWKAKAYAGQKRWQLALDTLKQAEELFPEYLQEDKTQILKERATALFALGQVNEAYKTQESFIQKHEQLDEKEKKQQLNQLQVQFGYKIKEQENQLLKKDNLLKEQQLGEAALIKRVAIILGALILLVLILLGFALWQVKVVKKAKARIHEILDNIEEGIFTVGRDLKVESSLSPYLDHVIGHDAPETAKTNLVQYLLDKSDLSADQKQIMREVITSSLDEGSLHWELNSSHLPQELHLDQGKRILTLHWQALYGKDQRIKRILVAVRDATVRRQLELEIDRAKAQRGRIQHILEEVTLLPPKRFQSFIFDAQDKILGLRQNQDPSGVFRLHLHSLKGEARSLGLQELATATHQLENYLDPQFIQTPSMPTFETARQGWLEVWNDYENIAQHFHTPAAAPVNEASDGLVQLIAEQWPALQRHCQSKGLHLHQLIVEEELFPWHPEIRKALKDSLLHALMNSVDHGFLSQEQQAQPSSPSLAIRLHRNERGLIELTVRDNGQGLNWRRLRELIQERNFVPKEGQTLADVVFTEGFTTSEALTSTSGRGVGLAAIDQIARKFHGQAHIKDREDTSGCELSIQLADGF